MQDLFLRTKPALPITCTINNGACQQMCKEDSSKRVICSCASGYKLGEDGKSCTDAVQYPCGKVSAPEALPKDVTRSILDFDDHNFTSVINHNSTENLQPDEGSDNIVPVTVNPNGGFPTPALSRRCEATSLQDPDAAAILEPGLLHGGRSSYPIGALCSKKDEECVEVDNEEDDGIGTKGLMGAPKPEIEYDYLFPPVKNGFVNGTIDHVFAMEMYSAHNFHHHIDI
ncbi:unnamed protein product [Ranitomeya imitator]|uniref:EGF-like domain-containing protein n=1 Tax=Ranitomeya imitator TaxID=111125 RepID=A0ABN9L2M9_9NEOB|nr:unnamed protein product [Ranitomeya imitator]